MSEQPVKFKATIKSGAMIGIDHGWEPWRKPDIVFDVEARSYGFDCRAPGYGSSYGKDYGNGSVTVYRLSELVISPEDRARVIDGKRREKLSQIADKTQELNKLAAELAALSQSPDNGAPRHE